LVERRVGLLTAAVVLAAIGTFLVYLVAANRSEPVPQMDVLVADKVIPAGTTADQALGDNLIKIHSVDEDDVADDAVGNLEAIAGQVAVTTIYPGQQLLTTLWGESVETQSPIGNLPEDMIATSYEFTDTGRVAGFVSPGSKVAVFLNSGSAGDGQNQLTTRVLLPNVQVLAVANVTSSPPADPSKANPEPLSRALVTLALTQEQTEKMQLAKDIGTLALALRTEQSEVAAGPGLNAEDLFQ
jgi:pilus assembly protein CpaB